MEGAGRLEGEVSDYSSSEGFGQPLTITQLPQSFSKFGKYDKQALVFGLGCCRQILR